MADTVGVTHVDWHAFDLEPLRAALRSTLPAPEAEKMSFAFERALEVARIDVDLLDFLAAAVVCLLATDEETTPRHVLEELFRRSVTDEEWRGRYASLLR